MTCWTALGTWTCLCFMTCWTALGTWTCLYFMTHWTALSIWTCLCFMTCWTVLGTWTCLCFVTCCVAISRWTCLCSITSWWSIGFVASSCQYTIIVSMVSNAAYYNVLALFHNPIFIKEVFITVNNNKTLSCLVIAIQMISLAIYCYEVLRHVHLAIWVKVNCASIYSHVRCN